MAALLLLAVALLTRMYREEKILRAAHPRMFGSATKEPPPIYGGVASAGGPAIPVDAQNRPAYFFEGKADWQALGIKEPRTGWEFAQRGMYYQDEVHDITAALADYRKAAAMEPELMSPKARMGSIYLRQGKYDEAIREFQAVSDLDPLKQEVQYRIGQANEGRGDYQSAIRAYHKELELAPGAVKTNYSLAMAYNKVGDHRSAALYLKRYLDFVELHGDNYPLRVQKAKKMYDTLVSAGNPQGAREP